MGVYVLWYPVINRTYITRLESDFRRSGIRNILLAELTVAPASTQGMSGSGVIVVNPPWTLQDSLQEMLPYLAGLLGSIHQNTEHGKYRVDTLIPE
jgi:23S rRNA (adenine2030-N6)-methyltransferase